MDTALKPEVASSTCEPAQNNISTVIGFSGFSYPKGQVEML